LIGKKPASSSFDLKRRVKSPDSKEFGHFAFKNAAILMEQKYFSFLTKNKIK